MVRKIGSFVKQHFCAATTFRSAECDSWQMNGKEEKSNTPLSLRRKDNDDDIDVDADVHVDDGE